MSVRDQFPRRIKITRRAEHHFTASDVPGIVTGYGIDIETTRFKILACLLDITRWDPDEAQHKNCR